MRQRRKKTWLDHKKGTSPRKLMLLLVVVLVVIWYLSARF